MFDFFFLFIELVSVYFVFKLPIETKIRSFFNFLTKKFDDFFFISEHGKSVKKSKQNFNQK